MTRIYILRKHEPKAINGWLYGKIHADGFTIAGTFAERAACKAAAENLNKRAQNYVYTVGVVTLKGGAA